MIKYSGACFCGAVRFEVSAEPIAQAICHCTMCRSWSASPFNGAALFPRGSVAVTEGKELVSSYAKTEGHDRQWCSRCGGHLFSDHVPYGIIDVFASVLQGFIFTPTFHVNYIETILPMKDGLPKYKDFPKNHGGTGELVSE